MSCLALPSDEPFDLLIASAGGFPLTSICAKFAQLPGKRLPSLAAQRRDSVLRRMPQWLRSSPLRRLRDAFRRRFRNEARAR